MKAVHLEDMQAQLSAHKLALVAAKEEAEQLLKARLKDVQEAHCLKQGKYILQQVSHIIDSGGKREGNSRDSIVFWHDRRSGW